MIASWFLLGGTLYTAFTFIAFPGVFFGQGALGFYSTAQSVFMFPFFILVLPRFWTIARHRGYITIADFVRDRYSSRFLALLVAITGILAMMPYLALQIFGIEVSLAQLGLPVNLSVFIAFAFLAFSTYNGGLRATAVIAYVKGVLIWIVGIVALVIITSKLGGINHIFHEVPSSRVLLVPTQYSAYLTLALGSAFALFLYPHVLTGVLSANGQKAVRNSIILLPIFNLLLAIFGLFGFMATVVGLKPSPIYKFNAVLPMLFAKMLPPEFAGIALATICISALVPAAMMSIAAANLFTRNIYRAYFRSSCNEREEVNVARLVSLCVKAGALVFLIFPFAFVSNLQLLGGMWILQIIPTALVGLYTNKLHRSALVVGWIAGMLYGTLVVVAQNFNTLYTFHIGTTALPIYIGLIALVINLALSVVLTPVFQMLGLHTGRDETRPADFEAHPVTPLSLSPSILLNNGRNIPSSFSPRVDQDIPESFERLL